LVSSPAGVGGYDRVSFTIRGERPMRVSVQLRAPVSGGEPRRWQRSIYVAADNAPQTIRFEEMSPVGEGTAPPIAAAAVRDVLFVVDTVNSIPGASGRVWLRDVRLEK
jgi:hypothetical protein